MYPMVYNQFELIFPAGKQIKFCFYFFENILKKLLKLNKNLGIGTNKMAKTQIFLGWFKPFGLNQATLQPRGGRGGCPVNCKITGREDLFDDNLALKLDPHRAQRGSHKYLVAACGSAYKMIFFLIYCIFFAILCIF